MNTPVARARVWDLPTRLFHWTLVALIALQFATAQFGLLDMSWHFRFGYATLALIVFRVVWGFVGSQTSRFTHFVRGPGAIVAYTRATFSREPHVAIGHNPLGGWSVLVFLASISVQCVSGLFSSDGVDTDGPLADNVTSATVKFFTRVHDWNQDFLLLLIAVHVVAIALYRVVRHDDLTGPMLTGRRPLETGPLHFASNGRALVVIVLAALAVGVLALWAQN